MTAIGDDDDDTKLTQGLPINGLAGVLGGPAIFFRYIGTKFDVDGEPRPAYRMDGGAP